MYRVTKYPQGAFSWADNSSSDPIAAKAFYLALFGWQCVDIPIGAGLTYTVFQMDGANVCALSGMLPDQLRAGVASQWNNFVTVDDVDAMVALVEAHGGDVVDGPEDVFDSGRMLRIQDPTGAALNLWQPYKSIGAEIVNTVGAMCWNELWTGDVARAKAFYRALFGWEYVRDGIFTRIYNRGRFNGGMLQLEGVKPRWLPHFHVADVELASERVKALGGAITVERQVKADGSGWAVASDPAGAEFYLMEATQADPWIE